MSGGISASTLAAGSLAMSAAGTGFSIFSSLTGQSAAAEAAAKKNSWDVYQSQVQAAAASAQAQWKKDLAVQRKTIAKNAEADSIQRGQVAENQTRLGTKQVMGQARARLAGQGTDFSGSAVDVYGDIAAAGEFNAQTVRSNAVREAYGHKMEQVDAENAYNLAQSEQDNARPGMISAGYTPSNYGAVTSAIAGTSDLAAKWWKFQQNGAFDSDPYKGTSPAAVGQPYGARPVSTSELV